MYWWIFWFKKKNHLFIYFIKKYTKWEKVGHLYLFFFFLNLLLKKQTKEQRSWLPAADFNDTDFKKKRLLSVIMDVLHKFPRATGLQWQHKRHVQKDTQSESVLSDPNIYGSHCSVNNMA